MTQSRRIRVRGQVQGVGFRPFIWQLAQDAGVRGTVCNDAKGVLIHAMGDDLDSFVDAITRAAPVLARVDAVESRDFQFDIAPKGFEIAQSGTPGSQTAITPDAATCDACLAEIRGTDPRRAGYAFTNCTHCGPRFTILHALPYDRAQTTMAGFALCPDCTAEYRDPADRRFHAQPVACARCGPRLWLETAPGQINTGDPISATAALLKAGQIVAIKGLGGFHLACDATNPATLDRLRTRKHRPGKPFALMGTVPDIQRYSAPTSAEITRLADAAAPIVLIRRGRVHALPDQVAPGYDCYGWMLPYTPLHHLLVDAMRVPLVMTSGNLSGEPQVIGNDEARDKLAGFADALLLHDRDIARRLDDSVERITPQGPMILRHARGRVPGTLPLPEGFADAPQTLAFGAHLKSALCLIKQGQALVSHHLGDLDDPLTWDEYQKADTDYADLFDHMPQVFACDLHPGYRASRYAAVRAGGKPLITVQHHHAHLAACLAENMWARDAGPVAGIILDGLGLGTDGTIWGGELLLGDYSGFSRIAHLPAVPLLGGDAAGHDPWRNLLAQLDHAECGADADRILADYPVDMLRRAARAGVNAPLSSSAGRLFDAVAAALGVMRDRQTYEGEAAIRLEALARTAPAGFAAPYPVGSDLDSAPMIRALLADLRAAADPAVMAARFHAGLAAAFCDQARALVSAGRAQAVVLSGGCFQNPTLLDLCCRNLSDLPVLIHNKLPPNDGSLALGQAMIAAAHVLTAAESN